MTHHNLCERCRVVTPTTLASMPQMNHVLTLGPEDIRVATLAAVQKGARSDAEAVRNYREAERVIRTALPYLNIQIVEET